ncbi:MAG: insulinase family protein [Bryobacteraceae bacterium]|nr:insulinase family protein [Bryobacteraceae bacterium]MDW8377123.1 pitrilysin family protein [Bryobacterales bacterium]
MKFWPYVLMIMVLVSPAFAATLTKPGNTPLVTIRLVFRTGAAFDPPGKEGLAALTAAMLAQAGSKSMTYSQILEAMFPMATSIEVQVDKEMTTFGAETHIDNLERFYSIFRSVLLEPGWRQEDLKRLKEETINFLRVSLRSNNEEELGKEALYNEIYAGHPYGWHNLGRVSAVEKLTVSDLQAFYRAHYTQANLTIALAGGYPADFPRRVERDFAVLPKGKPNVLKLPAPKKIVGRHLLLIEKPTRSVAISLGFPIAVRRGHPDYPALLVAQSYLGQHRTSGVRLYERLREARGLNYGDYAYLEYFPRGMYQFEPDPNLARQQQIFQVWIRPVQPETAHFALRLAIFELEKFFREGLSQADFEKTRQFLTKYVNLLIKTKRAELGYDIDSRFYGIADYATYVKTALAKLTREDVHRAIQKHLPPENMQIVMIAQGCEKLKEAIAQEAPSPMRYNAPKPKEILEEDRLVEKLALGIQAENIKIVKVETLFE